MSLIRKMQRWTFFVLLFGTMFVSTSAMASGDRPDGDHLIANPDFPTDYTVMAGEPVSYTFPIVDVVLKQVGMFKSLHSTIDYIDVVSISGLPTGFSTSQATYPLYPVKSTFTIGGTIAQP